MIKAKVIAVSKSKTHTFSKFNCDSIRLVKGKGVEGDAHMGAKVKHRSRVAKDPNQPNLRQVHLIPMETLEELGQKGFHVIAGQMGENITTAGIALHQLPKGTLLSIGETAKIRITGLRNPCKQIDSIQEGLMKAVLDKDREGNVIRKAGIMGVVTAGGEIKTGDEILISLPQKPFTKLDRV